MYENDETESQWFERICYLRGFEPIKKSSPVKVIEEKLKK